MLVPLSSISSCLRLTDTPAGAAGAPNLDLLLGMGCFCQCYAQESVQNLLKTTAYVSGIFNNDTSMHICIGRSIYLYDVCVFTVNICIYIYLYIHWIGQHIGHQGTPDTSTELPLSKAGTSNIGLRDGRS